MLRALGRDPELAQSSLRLSLGRFSTAAEVDAAATAIRAEVQRLRALAGTAKDADAFLSSRGLILRRIDAYGLPHALRLTVGSEEANRLVVEALRDFMKGA